MKAFYSKSRISFSLKTKCLKQAHRSSLQVSQNLESHWISLRLQGNQFGIDRYVKGFCKVPDSEDVNKDDITFSYALEIYLIYNRHMYVSYARIYVLSFRYNLLLCHIVSHRGINPTPSTSC